MGWQAWRQEAPECLKQEMLNYMCGEKQLPGLREIVREVQAGWGAISKLPLPGCFGQIPKASLHKLLVLS